MADQAELEAIVNTIKNWSDEWLLRLIIDKCKTVSYHSENPISTLGTTTVGTGETGPPTFRLGTNNVLVPLTSWL